MERRKPATVAVDVDLEKRGHLRQAVGVAVALAAVYYYFAGEPKATFHLTIAGRACQPHKWLGSRDLENCHHAITSLEECSKEYFIHAGLGGDNNCGCVTDVVANCTDPANHISSETVGIYRIQAGDETEDQLWLLWIIVWIVVRFFQLVSLLALILLLALVFQQRRILYVPVPPGVDREPMREHYPDRFAKIDSFEDVTITTEDGVRINGWFVYQKNPTTVPYTILYFHGNAGNIGFRMDNINQMYTRLNYNILIIDYRGYGRSDDGGGPCEDGFLKDAKASYRWIIDRIQHPKPDEKAKMSLDRILFFGRSIGGAVALRLGAQLLQERLNDAKLNMPLQPLPAGFILENTFTNLREMAIQIFGFLKFVRPVLRWPLVRDEWKADEALKFISENHEHWCLCLLSGRKDQIVPPQQMDALRDIAESRRPQVLRWNEFREGSHNDTPIKGGHEYWQAMNNFMDEVRSSENDRKRFFENQASQ